MDAKWGFKELSHHDVLLRTPRLCKVLAHDRSHQTPEGKPGFHRRLAVLSIKVDSALNLPFNKWTEIPGSERLTGALLNRLTHHVHILEMNAESYRLKESKKIKPAKLALKRHSSSTLVQFVEALPLRPKRTALRAAQASASEPPQT